MGRKAEDDFRHHTLRALAGHFGAAGQVQQQVTLVDPRVQWPEAENIWHNAAIRTGIFAPLERVCQVGKR